MDKARETIAITSMDLWNIFYWGVDFGQMLMEQERENEEMFDAALCSFGARKFNVPTVPVRRRQLHSEKWFNAKKESYNKWLEFQKKFNASANE